MSNSLAVTLPQALGYRGGQPMTAWLLHRISGIGIVLFVSMHVFAAFFLYATRAERPTTIANAAHQFLRVAADADLCPVLRALPRHSTACAS